MSKNPPVTDETDTHEQITAVEEKRLRAWIKRDQPAAVAKAIKISRATLTACLARLPVQHGTLVAVRDALSRLDLRGKTP